MDAQSELIPYDEAIKRSGLIRRTWYERIRETGVVVYQDGRDRRLRLIAEPDIAKLLQVQPAQRRERTAA